MGEDRQKALREAFGKVLRTRRHELGLSQEELAERANLSMRFISQLETDKQQPTLTKLDAIASGVEMSLTDFVESIEKNILKRK